MPGSAWPLLVLPVTLFLRMAFNAIDGLMAKEHGQASAKGAVLNEISDVVADAALYLPFALIAGVNAPLVVLVVVAGIVAEMTGALGPMLGGHPQLCRAVRKERPGLRLRLACGADRRWAYARPVEHALSFGVAGAVGADRAQPRPRHRRLRQREKGMSGFLGLPANVVYATAGIYAVLALATAIVALLRWRNPGERYAELTARTDSWWWMIGAFTLCVLVNQTVAIVFLAFISYLALKEYLSLIPTRRIDRAVLLFAYLAIPIQFYWAAIDWYGMFIVFVPVWMFLFFPALMALKGETQGFLRAVGTLSWGLMMTVFTLSHMAWLLVSGDHVNPIAGGVGLLFFLVVLTQFNDVAQYHLGQAHRPPQGDADREPEKDLGGADRRRRHHHRRRRFDRALPHADGLALVGAGRRHSRRLRLSRRHYPVGGQARSRRQGYRRADPRPWRHSRPGRQPHLCRAGLRAFHPLFLLSMSQNPITRLFGSCSSPWWCAR